MVYKLQQNHQDQKMKTATLLCFNPQSLLQATPYTWWGQHGPWLSVQSTLPSGHSPHPDQALASHTRWPHQKDPVFNLLRLWLWWHPPCPPNMDPLSQATIPIPRGPTCCFVPQQLHTPLPQMVCAYLALSHLMVSGQNCSEKRKGEWSLLTLWLKTLQSLFHLSQNKIQTLSHGPTGPINLSPTSLHLCSKKSTLYLLTFIQTY